MTNTSSDAAARLVPRERNSRWFTEAAVEEIRRDYETQIASLQRLLALRTDAMHRVAEENERLRAQHKVN